MANNAETSDETPALLLTRPRQSAEAFLGAVDARLLEGRDVCLSPLIEIRSLQSEAAIGPKDAAIFTSANAVPFAQKGRGRAAFCVGARTAAAARGAGWQIGHIAETAEALVSHLVRLRPDQHMVHLSGAHRRGDIVERLSQAALSASLRVVYEQALLPLSEEACALLEGSKAVIIPVFSPRTALHLAQTAPQLSSAHVLAISAAAAEPFGKVQTAALHVAQAPTADQMRQGVEILLRGHSLP